MNSPELKAALQELPHVQTIWFNEAGEWFFFEATGTVMSITRDEALGVEPTNKGEEIEPPKENKRKK